MNVMARRVVSGLERSICSFLVFGKITDSDKHKPVQAFILFT